MTVPQVISNYLNSVHVGTNRQGTSTIEELENALNMDTETVWEGLAVLLLRKEILLRAILKKRILVVKINECKHLGEIT